MAGALIVTAETGGAEAEMLERLRRAHFPPERNHLPAHLTMFHALPPSAEAELRGLLAELASGPSPSAKLTSVIDLGGGVAFRIESPDLQSLRRRIAERFHGSLTAQDAAAWRPHVTVQNKVDRKTAVALLNALTQDFRPCPLQVRGLELHRYLGGPWERLGRWRFRG